MSNAPEIQTKLREELISVETDTPSMDELMALPYLDAVVRETLRVYSPVGSTQRVVIKDDVIPVEKPYTDRYGIVHNSIRYAGVSDGASNGYPYPHKQRPQRRPYLYFHPSDQPVAGIVGS